MPMSRVSDPTRRYRTGLRSVGQWWRCPRRWPLVLVLLLVLGLGLRGAVYLQPLRVGDLLPVNQAVEFRDRHGRPLGTLLSRDQEHTAVVPLEQVSPHFLQAILAAEDQRFYHHGAVDGWAVLRAAGQALRTGRIVSGASTITMQLARMVEPIPHTLGGKLQQVWYAWRITAGTPKDDILAAYVNRLPMGGNLYGVEAAARVYFGVPAADLTLAQASLLAALPNAPSALYPYDHWDALKQRQAYVLGRMVEDGYLTQAQADRAYAQPLTLQPPEDAGFVAPHWLFWLADTLPPDHPPQVQTSLDLDLQRFVTAQIRQAIQSLAQHRVGQAAALVVDIRTGAVLAYVGSPSYFAPTGRNDGVQALRQPGSALKPFLYQLALEKGVIQPNTILADIPTHYPIPGAQLYSPTDYSETFQGPVRVRLALGNSLNVPAVQVLEKVGVEVFLARLHQLGFRHLQQSPQHYGLGLALGSGEVSLWELAQAYLILAHQGDFRVVLSGIQPNPPLPPTPLAPARPPTAATWALITDMLSDRHARTTAFGVDSVLNLPFPAAVKTGTSSDYRDTWTVGFTTDYLVATWVGNFDGSPMRQVSGVTGAAPLWHRIMVHLHEHQEPGPLPPPPGMVKRPICALTGQTPTSDCPGVVQEYFFAGTGQAGAAISEGASGGDTSLPPDPLAQEPTIPSTATAPSSGSSLRIRSPQTGSRFLLYPMPSGTRSELSEQRLEFAIAPPLPQQPIEWRLNGQPLPTPHGPSLFWPLQPGQWILEVRSGDQQDQVQFTVEMADGHQMPRGFSVVPAAKPAPPTPPVQE